MKLVLVGLTLFACCATAQAADKVKPQFVFALGDVLASEQDCNLTYNAQAIESYIKANVPASDIGFAGRLNTATVGAKAAIKEQSASEKAARCAHISNVAAHYKFVQ